MKDQLETMKRAIEHQNVAMEECIDVLVLGENVFAVGKTREGYANWAVSSRDDSSYWGHYGFTTRQGAVDDMLERAGVAK